LKKNRYTLTDTCDFTSGTEVSVKIPLTGYITHMNILFKCVITPGTSVSPAEDGLARIVDAAKIRAAGQESFFEISDGRQWWFWNYFRYEGQVRKDSLPSAGAGQSTVYMLLPIHLGYRPRDPFDPTIVIPSAELSNLKLYITWGQNSDLGTGFTIGTTTQARLTIHELTLEEGDVKEDIWPGGLLAPAMEAREEKVTSTYANLGYQDDVPVGGTLFQTVIMVLDSSGDRSSSYVSEVGVKFPKKRTTPFQQDWVDFETSMMTEFRTGSQQTGAGLLMWSQLPEASEYGLDLEHAMIGDAKLCFTVATADGYIHRLYYSVMPR